MAWVRDEGGCAAQHDGSARVARERYLLPGCESPVAIAGKPESFHGGATGNEPLPARNTPHPLDPGMLLDMYQVDTDGADAAIIALYSSDRRFRFPTVNAAPNNGFTWTLGTRNLTYSMPYAFQVLEVIGDATQSTGVIEPWKFAEDSVFESAQEVQMRFSVRPDRVPQALSVMYTRQNKLQRINGEYWLFVGGELAQGAAAGEYEMNVTWLREAGIPYAPAPLVWDSHGDLVADAPRPKMPAVHSTLPNVTEPTWHKPPFHRVFILPNKSGNPEDEPYFSAYCPYAFDETGYAAVVALIP